MTALIAIGILMLLSVAMAIRESRTKTGKVFPPPDYRSVTTLGGEASRTQVMFSVVGTSLGGAITIGYIGLVYKSGTVFTFAGLAFLLGLLILYVLIPNIRAHAQELGSQSLEEYIGAQSVWARRFAAIVNLICFCGLLLAQVAALRLLLVYRFPNQWIGLFIAAMIIVIAYTAIYGLMGVFENDKIQVTFVAFWVFAVVFVLFQHGDSIPRIAELSPEMLRGTALGMPALIIIFLFLPWTALARADFWQRIVAASDERSVRNAFGVLLIVMFIAYVLFGLAGLLLRIVYPDVLDHNAVPYKILDEIPTMVKDLAVAGVFAALVSSADSFLNIASISVDSLFGRVGTDSESQKSRGIQYRISVFLVGFIAILVVLGGVDLGLLFIVATSIVMLLVPGFMSTLVGFAKGKVAYPVSIAIGLIAYGGGLIAPGIEAESAFVPGAFAALITFLLINWIEMARGPSGEAAAGSADPAEIPQDSDSD